MENNLFPHFCSIKSQIFFFHFFSLELQSPSVKSTCQKILFVRIRKVSFYLNWILYRDPLLVQFGHLDLEGGARLLGVWSLAGAVVVGPARFVLVKATAENKDIYIYIFREKSFERIVAHFFFYVSLQLKSQYFKRNSKSPPSEALLWGRKKNKAKI